MTKKLTMTVGTARRAVRNLALLAAVAVAIGARAERETVGDYTWTYVINGDTVAVVADRSGAAISPYPSGHVTVPSTLGGKPVTRIGRRAFDGCSGLTSVTIPESVTSIGARAFDDTPFFNDQPDGLVVLGNVAYKMKGLCPVTVMIPDGVTSIADNAFFGCSGLTSVTIPGSVTSIGCGAFKGCNGLAKDGFVIVCQVLCDYIGTGGHVTIPDGVTSIGGEAFSGCSGLTSVTISDSVTRIGDGAFEECPAYRLSLFRTIFGSRSPAVVTTIVQQVAAPYALTDHVADRAIASVKVNGDCAIDSFVLKDGEVYDCALRIVNTADHDVKVSLPSGYV